MIIFVLSAANDVAENFTPLCPRKPAKHALKHDCPFASVWQMTVFILLNVPPLEMCGLVQDIALSPSAPLCSPFVSERSV